jgi:hypothetical protein
MDGIRHGFMNICMRAEGGRKGKKRIGKRHFVSSMMES